MFTGHATHGHNSFDKYFSDLYSSITMSDDALLDTRGLKCPLPVLKARKRLKSLATGDILNLLSDDPMAVVDVPHFCTEAGHRLVKHKTTSEGDDLFVIEK